MFDRFNHHMFQSLKLSKLKADMYGPGRFVKILDPVTGVILKFLGAEVWEFYTLSYGR